MYKKVRREGRCSCLTQPNREHQHIYHARAKQTHTQRAHMLHGADGFCTEKQWQAGLNCEQMHSGHLCIKLQTKSRATSMPISASHHSTMRLEIVQPLDEEQLCGNLIADTYISTARGCLLNRCLSLHRLQELQLARLCSLQLV